MADDDETERELLQEFCKELKACILGTARSHGAPAAPGVCTHFYFMSRRHARVLLERLQARGLVQEAAWLGCVVGSSAAIEGEQPFVSWVEEEASRFATRWLGRDLYTLSMLRWPAAVAAGAAGGAEGVRGRGARAVAQPPPARFDWGGLPGLCGCGDTLLSSPATGLRQVRYRSTSASVAPGFFWAFWRGQQQLPPLQPPQPLAQPQQLPQQAGAQAGPSQSTPSPGPDADAPAATPPPAPAPPTPPQRIPCRCGRTMPRRVSRTSENPNRPFYKCDGCG